MTNQHIYTKERLNEMGELEKNIAVAEKLCPNATLIEKYKHIFQVGTTEGEKELYKQLHPEEFKDSLVMICHYDLCQVVDYCNAPNDIMPIAFEYGITLASHMSVDEWDAYASGYFVDHDHTIQSSVGIESTNSDPLIAIVDCFLMTEVE